MKTTVILANGRSLPSQIAFNLLPKELKALALLLNFDQMRRYIQSTGSKKIVLNFKENCQDMFKAFEYENSQVFDASSRTSMRSWIVAVGFNLIDVIIYELVQRADFKPAMEILKEFERVHNTLYQGEGEYAKLLKAIKEAKEAISAAEDSAKIREEEQAHLSSMLKLEKSMIADLAALPKEGLDRVKGFEDLVEKLDEHLDGYAFMNFFREFAQLMVDSPELIDHLLTGKRRSRVRENVLIVLQAQKHNQLADEVREATTKIIFGEAA
jgi:hypothetical protein